MIYKANHAKNINKKIGKYDSFEQFQFLDNKFLNLISIYSNYQFIFTFSAKLIGK